MKTQKTAYIFILPSMLILSVFVFVPLASSLCISLLNIDIFMQDISFAGFRNFRHIFSDERIKNATWNTLYFTVMEVPLQIVASLVIASALAKNTFLCKALRGIYYIPFVCSMTAIGIIWSMLLDPNMGLLPYWLRFSGLPAVSFLKDPNLAMPTVALITAWKGFGYTVTLLSAAILMVPVSLYEAAGIDGAGFIGKFLHITIPGIKTAIGFCIVTNIISSLQVFDQTYVMTKGGPSFRTETLVQYIYDRGFQTAPYDLGYASAISLYLFVIVAIITFLLRRFVINEHREEKI
ncbi:MAG: sugar ABC transporter permease [Treponema sp.]|jgi:multiple sugar transport system permease protein|nr:sugar ABC transporter permease [Treponema sp.]